MGRLRKTLKLLMTTQWHNNKSETKWWGKNKAQDVPVWLYKSGGAGYQHVGMTERQSVGIFLTLSHHRMTSDSWDKTLSFPRYLHMQPWANVCQTHQPFVSSWIISILNMSESSCIYILFFLCFLWLYIEWLLLYLKKKKLLNSIH